MKRLLLAMFLVSVSCSEVQAPTGGPGGAVTAFVGVNVVPMDSERVLENQTVLVENGYIGALGPAAEVEVPEGAIRIDGAGKYLMPGLAEMHGHLPSPDTPAAVTENVLFLYVASGVTTVRGMQGNESQIALRARVDRGELVGPRLVLGSPSMSGASVPTVEDAQRLVAEYKQAGFDLLKVHENLTPEVYDAIAAAAKEAGIPFGGHVTDTVGLFHALEAGQTTIDHLDNYVESLVPDDAAPPEAPGLLGAEQLLSRIDESRIPLLVQATLDADVSVVPTMVLWESGIYATRPSSELLQERSEVRYMPRDTVDRWVESVDERVKGSDPELLRRLADVRRRILMALHEGGVRILLGTDSPQIFSVPGFSIHREMQFYVDAGMSPYDVLSSGTRVVGDYFGENFGTVSVGEGADLILVDGNPLSDIENVSRISGVMARGKYVSREEIETRLAAIAASYES
ncbi:MAG TPA: amidohydrolase family protein [Vicinamibacteria bacterium]|nr:amidohydrolase family protein [Vicinamibacteria bacterium]